MFREPWFEILEVHEQRGRSMADIAAEVAHERRVSLREMLSRQQARGVASARIKAIEQIKAERLDLTSGQVAQYFNLDASTVRKVWQYARRQQAA